MDNEKLNEENVNEVEETPQVDPVQLIKEKFGQYSHSQKVLARAVKSCTIKQINEYLTKRLDQEPNWENKWNIVESIIDNIDLPKCQFCGKRLSYSNIAQKKFYCSEECEKTDLSLKESKIEPAGYETVEKTVQKTTNFIEKIKKFFKRK